MGRPGQIPSEDPHWERNADAFKKLFLYLFICLYLAMLGLCCCVWAFSSCSDCGYSLAVVCVLVIFVASLVGEHRLWGAQASVIVALGF